MKKRERQICLSGQLQSNPFLTDEELAESYAVSIQTIRLDRHELEIPELRERIKHVAEGRLDQVEPLHRYEVTGKLLDLKPNQSAISLLKIGQEHLVSETSLVNGHFIFAQANTLAIATVNTAIALTGAASIQFIRPAKLNERLIARASIRNKKDEKTIVQVETRVDDELVFSGDFLILKAMEEQKA